MKKFLFLLICIFLFVQPFSAGAFSLNQGLNVLKKGADIVKEDQKAEQKLAQQKLNDARNGGNKAKSRAESLLDKSDQNNISLSTFESQLRRDLSTLNDVLFKDNPDAIHSASSSLRRSSDEFEVKLNKTIQTLKEQRKKVETARAGANNAKQRAENLLSTAQRYGISMSEKTQLKDDLIALDNVINNDDADKIDSATKYVTSSSDKFEVKLNIERISIDKQREKEAAKRAKIEKERREIEAAETARAVKEKREIEKKEAAETAKVEKEKREKEVAKYEKEAALYKGLKVKGLYVGMNLKAAQYVIANLTGKTYKMRKICNIMNSGDLEIGEGVWASGDKTTRKVCAFGFDGGASNKVFKTEGISAKAFVELFMRSYKIQSMEQSVEYSDIFQKFYTTWKFENPQKGYKLVIAEDKSVLIRKISKTSEMKFD